MARITVVSTAVVSAACLLAACQGPVPTPSPSPTPSSSVSQTAPTPPPTPTPSPTCTPEAGGAEYPCTQAQYDEMQAKDKLYEEAEAVFLKFHAESVRISRKGGITEPTETILATTEGSARNSVMESMRGIADRGTHAEGDDPTVSLTRVPGLSKDGSVVTLRACIDASKWGFYKGKELISSGRPAENRVFFSRFGNGLKMTYIEGKWVESCA